MKKKSIVVFTAIRSEYGLLTPVLNLLQHHEKFDLKLVVAGAHLLNAYGHTIDEIKKDGFFIDEEISFMSEDDGQNTYTNMLSRLQLGFAQYLQANPADLLLILGDRFELLPVVTTSLLMNTPIAHISGGEFTEGAVDNQIRHAITKMAHLHFPATETYKNNLIRMGEEEWRICVSGEPGIDKILSLKFLPKDELFQALGLNGKRKVICCTFHPETISNAVDAGFVNQVLIALAEDTDCQILVTASNFDHGGAEINEALAKLAAENSDIIYHKSLGQLKYYSLLQYAEVMVGNSSSGLVEAKSFNLPVINVGDRQKGRLANSNVINCPANVRAILDSMKRATSQEFRKMLANMTNIYGDGKASRRIVSFIEQTTWEELLIKRKTY
jgi:GDP/UDP-N,N'-diacetylbacillosamine 2-epimerase (hydrolysing)